MPTARIKHHWNSSRRPAFTLTEMLVVLGIILLLLSMLLIGAVTMRKAARQTLCLHQLQDMALAVTNYSQRYDGLIPLGSWADIGATGGMPSESPMSSRGYGTMQGEPANLYGNAAGPLPLERDALQAFLNTKEQIWRCPNQPATKGAVLLSFVGSGFADDGRGFRPGYHFMSTLDMRAFVRSSSPQSQDFGKLILATELLVRNIGGVKSNRIKTADHVDSSRIVLAYDSSITFHSKDLRELWEIPANERPRLTVNMAYLDGHAEEKGFAGREGFVALLHGPVAQKAVGSDLEAEFPEGFNSSKGSP